MLACVKRESSPSREASSDVGVDQAAFNNREAGLTLVELVVTIVLMGILAGGTVAFVVSSTQSYVDTATRNQLSAIGRLTTTRLELGIKNAVPNSFRTANNCLEFLPLAAISIFLEAPLSGTSASSSTTMEVVPISGLSDARYAVIYPTNPDSLYDVSAVGPTAAIESVSGGTVTFTSAHEFTARGAVNRVFFAKAPESFCIDTSSGFMYRYRSGTYAMQSAQPVPGDLPSGPPSRAVVSAKIENGALTPFSYSTAGLQNAGLVRLTLKFVDGDESLLIEQEVLNEHAP